MLYNFDRKWGRWISSHQEFTTLCFQEQHTKIIVFHSPANIMFTKLSVFQCSCLENPRNGGACWAVVYGVARSRTRLKWLSSSSSSNVINSLTMWPRTHTSSILTKKIDNPRPQKNLFTDVCRSFIYNNHIIEAIQMLIKCWMDNQSWEKLKAGGEVDDRGQDGWMASLTQWAWVWASSNFTTKSWWRTGKPGVLQSM